MADKSMFIKNLGFHCTLSKAAGGGLIQKVSLRREIFVEPPMREARFCHELCDTYAVIATLAE